MAKTRRASRALKGGGYSFSGGLLDASAANGGNPGWTNTTSTDCGAVAGRGGNDMTGGKRRRRRGGAALVPGPDPPPSHGGTRRRRRRHRGGNAANAALTTGRGGNGTMGGSRRRRRRHRGGNAPYAGGNNQNPDLAQQVPRTNYSFGGDGVAGMVNWTPDSY
uniref:Uncharacterized protein n=1 Tax=viral metagenome TaxID=1070528 RepID=A0A6C0I5N4_9ZZZZ